MWAMTVIPCGAMYNKANLPRIDRRAWAASVATGGNRAKQSQFPPGDQERQTVCGKGVMVNWTRTRPRKNKANSRTTRPERGPAWLPMLFVRLIILNKANLPRIDRARRWLQGAQVPSSLGTSAPNKANSAACLPLRPVGPVVLNKAHLAAWTPEGRRSKKSPVESPLWLSARNKPNLAAWTGCCPLGTVHWQLPQIPVARAATIL